ncbi:hypothetical protein CDL12_04805 [Handroanthus impetiginosus]|uniref:Uncharacterized protein n=1 Tax=Handroanthus impetiginosus TaxID=429701 RepID=A0A2G9HY82_9LAMI|nr:hypothetical protein CDL12_04805 [Handroanthus impetiginosus]
MENHKEMQLLSQSAPSSSQLADPPPPPMKFRQLDHFEGTPSLDLQLSISVNPFKPPSDRVLIRKVRKYKDVRMDSSTCVEALKWQAAEQIRLAAMEKAYAERVRELTRREMELAQSEFARARNMWERAREEVERAEKMKIDSKCMEITCQSCRQKFRP